MPRFLKRFSAALALSAFLPAQTAWGNPQFSHTEAGDIRIEESGAVYNIYSADKSIGAFTQFSNAAGETINSIQASADHSVIFKVIGEDPTQIFGALNANSHVFLVNPNGIVFAPGAQVNAPGLVAAAMDLKSADFDSDEFRFSAPAGGGYVLNEGTLNASSGYIALIGTAVENRGTISTPNGSAILASGGAATVGLDGDGLISVKVTKPVESAVYDLQGNRLESGLQNSGTISASGGAVLLTADAMEEVFDQAINHEGVIEAKSVEDRGGVIVLLGGSETTTRVDGAVDATGGAGEKGGRIQISGGKTAITDHADVDASGALGGGTVLIGGGFQGKEPAVVNSSKTVVTSTASIKADGTESGDGGTVVVWADDATNFYGKASARGAAAGKGGLVEVSGHELVEKGSIDVTAENGVSGTILYDPEVIQIVGGTADGDDTAGASSATNLTQGSNSVGSLFLNDEGSGTPNPFVIYESEIEGSNANIYLEARRSITATGSYVNGDVALGANHDITLTTRNNATDGAGVINLAGVLFQTAGTGDIDISGGTSGVSASVITLGQLQTASGDIFIDNFSSGLTTIAGTLTTAGGDININVSGKLKFNDGITTGGGDLLIDVSSFRSIEIATAGLTFNTSAVAGGGDIDIYGDLYPNTNNYDFTLDSRGLSTSAGGDVDIDSFIPNPIGAAVFNDITINASGTGALSGGDVFIGGAINTNNTSDMSNIAITGGIIDSGTIRTLGGTGATIHLTSDNYILLGFLDGDSDGDGQRANVTLNGTNGVYDGNGNGPNVIAELLTLVSSNGSVGAGNPLEVQSQTLNGTGVSGTINLTGFYTGDPIAAAIASAGVQLEGNRIVGGENFEQFTTDASTATDTDSASGQKQEESKKEEKSAVVAQVATTVVAQVQLVEAPASFPAEKPVDAGTFKTCA